MVSREKTGNSYLGHVSSVCARGARRKTARSKTALVAILAVAAPQPVWAGSGSPNTQAPPPSAYVTNTGALTDTSQGGCSQQYNPTIAGFVDQQLIAQATQLAADVGGTTAKITAETATQVANDASAAAKAAVAAGLVAAAAGVAIPTGPVGGAAGAAPGLGAAAAGATADTTAETAKAVASAAKIVALGFDVTKNVASGVALGFANDAQNLRNDVAAAGLPNCNQTYNGTITSTVPSGQPGLVIQNGSAYIGGDTSVAGNLGVGGDITASKLKATQGISAYGDQITIGNADLETFQEGITIGGGAFAGAGTGGTPATTGHKDAVAIGNGANASNANDSAFGTGANASGGGATAMGASSLASGQDSVAVGELDRGRDEGHRRRQRQQHRDRRQQQRARQRHRHSQWRRQQHRARQRPPGGG